MLPRLMTRSFRSCHIPIRFNSVGSTSAQLDPEVRRRIETAIRKDKVVVFMKGTQQRPMCGFSGNVKLVSVVPRDDCSSLHCAQILDYHRVPFRDYDVLKDDDMREGIKQFTDWPTIPQLFVDAEFVGGCDIVIQMHKNGEITDFFDQQGIPSRFSDKFPQNAHSDENDT